MKSSHGCTSQLLRTTTMSDVPGMYRGFDSQKERAMNALTVVAGVAAILAMYVVMFAAVYLWSRHAPIFPANGAGGLAMVEAVRWSRSA
jgi:hypothetical protein